MNHTETSTTIDASPERAWEVLGGLPLHSHHARVPVGPRAGVGENLPTPEGEGRTRFDMREEFTGPMLPLIGRTIPDMSDSFRQFASGLKQRVESGGR
jgi:hypothetical protein